MVMPYNHPAGYKIGMNMGIQCNYNLPWNATEFTNPPYWDQRDLHGELAANNASRFKRDISGGEFYVFLETLVAE